MSILFEKSANVGDPIFEKYLLSKIKDGKESVFIEETKEIRELLNTFFEEIKPSFEDCLIVDGINIKRKIGLVYLPSEIYNSTNKVMAIYQMIPSLKYHKDDREISTSEYIKYYSNYHVLIEDKKYILSVVQYSEAM